MVCELPRKLFDILLPSRNENTDDAIQIEVLKEKFLQIEKKRFHYTFSVSD